MVDVDSFYRLYRLLPGQPKRIKIFEGKHADNRPHEVEMEIIQFVISVFKRPKSLRHSPREPDRLAEHSTADRHRLRPSQNELLRPVPSRKRSASQNANLRTPLRSRQSERESQRFELDLRKAVPQKSRSPSKLKSISANKRSKNQIFDSDDEDRLNLTQANVEKPGSVSSLNANVLYRRHFGRSNTAQRTFSKQELATGNTTFIRNRSRSRNQLRQEGSRPAHIPAKSRHKAFGEDFFDDESFPNSQILGNRIKNQRLEWRQGKSERVDSDDTRMQKSASKSRHNASMLFVDTRDHRIHQQASNLIQRKWDRHEEGRKPGRGEPHMASPGRNPLKKSIGKAMDAEEAEHVIDGFDFGKHDMTNITIDASSLKDMLKNRLHNTSLNMTNVSQFKHFLNQPHVPGFSKMGEMNLNIRPSAIGKKTLIRKTNHEQSIGENKDAMRNPRRLGPGISVHREQFPGKTTPARPKPVVLRRGIPEKTTASRQEFVHFQRLQKDETSEVSLDSEDFDSFDLEKERQNEQRKDEAVRRAKVFGVPDQKEDVHKMKAQVERPSGRSSGFQPYVRILKSDDLTEEDFQESQRNIQGQSNIPSQPQVGSLQVKFLPKESVKKNKNRGKAQVKRETSLESSEDKYEKVNIYKDSIYQDSINKYIKQSQLKLSSKRIIKSTNQMDESKPMKPDTNEDFIGT